MTDFSFNEFSEFAGYSLDNLTSSNITIKKTLVSDNFDSLSEAWMFTNPVGDATVGLNTTVSQLQITVPATTSHDLQTGRIYAPRYLQATEDTAFSVKTKIDSIPSADTQFVGLIAQNSELDFVSIEVSSDGTNTRNVVKNGVSGTVTEVYNQIQTQGSSAYLKMERYNSNFYFYWSNDDITYNYLTSITKTIIIGNVGLYAGNHNAGTPPLFNALFDNFLVDNLLWTPAQLSSTLLVGRYETNSPELLTDSINASAGLVSQWDDQSGNGYHIAEGTGSSQPSLNMTGLNGLPTVNFNANKDLRNSNATTVAYTMAVAASPTTTFTNYHTFASSLSSGERFGGIAQPGSRRLHDNVYPQTLVVDAVAKAASSDDISSDITVPFLIEFQSASGSGSIAALTVGNLDSATIGGACFQSALLLFSSVPDADTIERCQGYLAHRYGTPLPPGHTYETTPPYL